MDRTELKGKTIRLRAKEECQSRERSRFHIPRPRQNFEPKYWKSFKRHLEERDRVSPSFKKVARRNSYVNPEENSEQKKTATQTQEPDEEMNEKEISVEKELRLSFQKLSIGPT